MADSRGQRVRGGPQTQAPPAAWSWMLAPGPRRSVRGEARVDTEDTRGPGRMWGGLVGAQERKISWGQLEEACTESGPSSQQGLLLPLGSPAHSAHFVREGPRSSEQTQMPPIQTLRRRLNLSTQGSPPPRPGEPCPTLELRHQRGLAIPDPSQQLLCQSRWWQQGLWQEWPVRPETCAKAASRPRPVWPLATHGGFQQPGQVHGVWQAPHGFP